MKKILKIFLSTFASIVVLIALLALGAYWRFFIYNPNPPLDMQVEINLEVDGQPVRLSRVLHCERKVKWNEGFGKHSIHYLSPDVRVFGERLPNGGAVITWAPERCNDPVLNYKNAPDPENPQSKDHRAIRSDGRHAHLWWRPVPEGNLPMIGWVDDADNLDEILLYASPQAYENKNARIKFISIEMKKPDIGRPVDKPDEFAWLGTTMTPERPPSNPYDDTYKHSAYCLFPLQNHRLGLTQTFWDKIDRDKNELQIIEPFGHRNGDIGLAFELPEAHYEGGGSLWRGWEKNRNSIEKNIGHHPTWIDCYPLKLVKKYFVMKNDMRGFVYAYNSDYLRKISDFIPIHFLGGEILSSDPAEIRTFQISGNIPYHSYLQKAFYVPSENQIFILGGAGFLHREPPKYTKRGIP